MPSAHESGISSRAAAGGAASSGATEFGGGEGGSAGPYAATSHGFGGTLARSGTRDAAGSSSTGSVSADLPVTATETLDPKSPPRLPRPTGERASDVAR